MIGFVRHFKVNDKAGRKWMTAGQFNDWVAQYDRTELIPSGPLESEPTWDVCYCSHLSRARRTAETLYRGETVITEQLREIGIQAVTSSGIRLPLTMWLLLARMAWTFSHKSQEEKKAQTSNRAKEVVDQIEEKHPSGNVLIISHGAFIKVLAKELRRRGYVGRTDIVPKNGKLYVYDRG